MTSPGADGAAATVVTPTRNSRSKTESGRVGAGLREIGWRRPDDFLGGDSRRRIEREHRRDEGLFARLVRLRVQAFGQRDLQRHTREGSGLRRALDERRDLGARTARTRSLGQAAPWSDATSTITTEVVSRCFASAAARYSTPVGESAPRSVSASPKISPAGDPGTSRPISIVPTG